MSYDADHVRRVTGNDLPTVPPTAAAFPNPPAAVPPPAPRYPIGVMPAQSDHGDVHHLIVTRNNGDSVTVADLRWVHWRLTGRLLADWEIPWDWFAEEDR